MSFLYNIVLPDSNISPSFGTNHDHEIATNCHWNGKQKQNPKNKRGALGHSPLFRLVVRALTMIHFYRDLHLFPQRHAKDSITIQSALAAENFVSSPGPRLRILGIIRTLLRRNHPFPPSSGSCYRKTDRGLPIVFLPIGFSAPLHLNGGAVGQLGHIRNSETIN